MPMGAEEGGGTEEETAHWVRTITTSSAIASDVDRCTLQLVLSATSEVEPCPLLPFYCANLSC